MFLWIYNTPRWLLFLLVTLASVGLCWGIVLLVRPMMKRWVGADGVERHNQLIEFVCAGTGLLYGLLLGLVAVATYTTYADNKKIVDDEANALGGFYRDASFYPQPLRGEVQGEIRDYVRYVIEDAWPEQQRGQVPGGGVDRITRMYGLVSSYQPPGAGEEALQSETLSQFNKFIENHRKRLTAVQSSLPGPLWAVLILGALVNLVLMAMPVVRSLRFHLMFSGLFAFFVSMVIFLTLIMDNSFLGRYAIGPTAYEVIRDRLMSRF